MSKGKSKKVENVPATEQGTEQKTEQARPLSVSELNALVDKALADKETGKAVEILSATPANEIFGTKGKFRTSDGKITENKELAKRSVSGRLVPAYTQARTLVIDGVTLTGAHVAELKQLRRAYVGDRYGAIERCKAVMAKQNGNITQKQIDKELDNLRVPAAWRPRYNKDGSKASQYARHLSVLAEHGVKASD